MQRRKAARLGESYEHGVSKNKGGIRKTQSKQATSKKLVQLQLAKYASKDTRWVHEPRSHAEYMDQTQKRTSQQLGHSKLQTNTIMRNGENDSVSFYKGVVESHVKQNQWHH